MLFNNSLLIDGFPVPESFCKDVIRMLGIRVWLVGLLVVVSWFISVVYLLVRAYEWLK